LLAFEGQNGRRIPSPEEIIHSFYRQRGVSKFADSDDQLDFAGNRTAAEAPAELQLR
jgi:hypothetical protein